MIRVVVADDQALVRAGLSLVLEAEEDIRVVGEAADGLEAVEEVLRLTPDVAVVDVRMPELNGIEAIQRLQERGCPTRILVVTTFHLDEYVLSALRSGAAGFMLKDSAPESLADAVRVIAAGDALLSPAVTTRLVESFVRQPVRSEALDGALSELTGRELEVMKLVARGMTNAEIAGSLFLGEATVKTHVTAILSKLGLRNRAQVVVIAYESGLIQIGDEPLAADGD